MSRRPSPAQLRLIAAILERGGVNVPGPKLFRNFKVKTTTLDACKRHDWITREDRNGVALWSVTHRGESDAERANEAVVTMAKTRARFKLSPQIGT